MRRAGAIAMLVLGLSAFPSGRLAAAPQEMTRDEITNLAISGVGYSYYWGHGAWRADGTQHGSCSGSCPSCTHSGSYGADCSGFVAKVWQVPSPIALETNSHPYSTYNFRYDSTHWSQINRSSCAKADAMVHNSDGSGHIVLYEQDDPWGSFWAYECRGCSYGCVHNVRTAGSSYVAIRRDLVVDHQGPDYDATAAGDSGAVVMASGEEAVVWFDFVNQGGVTWSIDTTRLGTQSPADRASVFFNPSNWIAANRATGADHSNYATGTTGRFTFSILAPEVSETTQYAEDFQLLQEGVAWFGPVVTLNVTVNPAAIPAPEVDAEVAVELEPDAGAAVEPDAKPAASSPEALGEEGELVGGCSASVGARPGTFATLFACAALLLTSRRRRRS